MALPSISPERLLRQALETSGHRFTEQRAAVFRFLRRTDVHPTADEVFLHVREEVPGISLATVYKSLETLVGCGLATKLTYGDGSARYDGRTDDHHHLRCVACGRVADLPGRADDREVARLAASADAFHVTGYRLELTGYCLECHPVSLEARPRG
ncbi:MAG TPA: transcriptional repressor [Longimicrobiales bacterium]|nr:transcriptional repressor [Longimicrobiales bacterium]